MSMFMLEESGLYKDGTVRAIQNRSGHGIDIIGKAATGAHAGSWDIFEVKTSTSNNVALSPRQASLGPHKFAVDILRKSSSIDAPFWKSARESQRYFASDVLDDMHGKSFRGFLIETRNVNLPSVNTTVKTWR